MVKTLAKRRYGSHPSHPVAGNSNRFGAHDGQDGGLAMASGSPPAKAHAPSGKVFRKKEPLFCESVIEMGQLPAKVPPSSTHGDRRVVLLKRAAKCRALA